MRLAQLLPDSVRVNTTDANYTFIQNTLRPSWFLKTALNLLLGGAGVFSFIYLLWGGLQWIMAGGDKDAIDKARKKIVGALIGLSIVFSSYAILYAVRVWFNINLIQVSINPLGSSGDPPGPPAGTPGNCRCHSCITGGYGYIGEVYQGAGNIFYRCDNDGWTLDNPPATSTTCGTTCI